MLMFALRNLKLKPVLVLRIGLGLTLIYAAVGIFTNPAAWVGFVPVWLQVLGGDLFLYGHAVFELILGLALLFGFFLPLVSFLIFLDLLAILLFYGVDDVTFRDFGLLMASLALFLLSRVNRDE